MDPPSKFNKISDIVKLQQILKKWKKRANANRASSCSTPTSNLGRARSFNFMRRTFSSGDSDFVPKGCLAVCVGNELKRYIIPTEYLGHQAFMVLLREAEEEFGFHQEGVLKIPCDVPTFEKILKIVEQKKTMSSDAYPRQLPEPSAGNNLHLSTCFSPDRCELTAHLPQTCT